MKDPCTEVKQEKETLEDVEIVDEDSMDMETDISVNSNVTPDNDTKKINVVKTPCIEVKKEIEHLDVKEDVVIVEKVVDQHCKVYVGIECVYKHNFMHLTQIAAVCPDTNTNFHATSDHVPNKCKKNKKLEAFFNYLGKKRILQDGTQLETMKDVECISNFLNFIKSLVEEKQKVKKKVALVLFSKYEIWCLQLMKKKLVALNIDMICLCPEDHPPNLSVISNVYTDSMLQVAQLMKKYSSVMKGAVYVPMELNIMNRPPNPKIYQLISAMDIPCDLLLSVGLSKGASCKITGIKSCDGAKPI